MNEKYLNILFKTTQVINRKFYIIITLQLYKKESYLSQYNEQYTYFYNGISKILLKLGNDGVNIVLHFFVLLEDLKQKEFASDECWDGELWEKMGERNTTFHHESFSTT